MTQSPRSAESRGYVAATVGGLLGGAVGMLVGVPIANANSEGGLEAVATALLIVFASLCVFTAIGAGVGVRIVKQPRALVTALITIPITFIATYGAAILATRAAETAIMLVPAIIVGSIVALLASRALARIGLK